MSLLLCAGFACALPVSAEGLSSAADVSAQTPDLWVERARADASASRYAPALAALDSALARDSRHFGARLLRARIFSWQARFPSADRELAALLAERPGDAEARLALAYLRYYEGRHEEAAIQFETLLAASPRDEDARAGLEGVRRAQAAALPKRWRVDAGLEYSAFTRRAQSAWNGQYAQLGYLLGDGKTRVHGRAEFYRRYALSDLYAEAGLARAFSPRLNASVAVGWTPDADFRPDWRLTAEAEFLALPGDGSMFPATWLLATSHYDVYQALEAWGLNPGLRLDWDPWAFTAHVNRVQEVGQEGLYGMTARLDGPLPVFPRHDPRFWLGYADVPETVALGGLLETVSTRTLFGGIGVAFAGDWMVLAGYARDDRENSYIRHVYNAGVSRKF